MNDVSNLARAAKGQIVTLQKFCQEHSQFWETVARSDKSYSVTQFVKEHGCLRHMDFLSHRRPSGGQDTDLEGWTLMVQKSSLMDLDNSDEEPGKFSSQCYLKKNLEYNNSNQPGMLLDVAVILPCFAASRAPKQIVSDYSTFLLFSNCEISFHVTKFHSM